MEAEPLINKRKDFRVINRRYNVLKDHYSTSGDEEYVVLLALQSFAII